MSAINRLWGGVPSSVQFIQNTASVTLRSITNVDLNETGAPFMNESDGHTYALDGGVFSIQAQLSLTTYDWEEVNGKLKPTSSPITAWTMVFNGAAEAAGSTVTVTIAKVRSHGRRWTGAQGGPMGSNPVLEIFSTDGATDPITVGAAS